MRSTKQPRRTEHIDPELVGNERRPFSSASCQDAATSKLSRASTTLASDKELMNRILAEVVRLENQGYQFESATASFDL